MVPIKEHYLLFSSNTVYSYKNYASIIRKNRLANYYYNILIRFYSYKKCAQLISVANFAE